MKLKNISSTKSHAAALAKKIKPHSFVLLSGELGAGKTEWVRSFIRAYLKEPLKTVPSPTYSVVNSFKKGTKEVIHMDLYRLQDSDDLESIGFWDYLSSSNIICVEWGEIIPKEMLRSRDVYRLHFDIISENERELACFFEPRH